MWILFSSIKDRSHFRQKGNEKKKKILFSIPTPPRTNLITVLLFLHLDWECRVPLGGNFFYLGRRNKGYFSECNTNTPSRKRRKKKSPTNNPTQTLTKKRRRGTTRHFPKKKVAESSSGGRQKSMI